MQVMAVHSCRGIHSHFHGLPYYSQLRFYAGSAPTCSTKGRLMKKLLVVAASLLCGTASFAQDKCLTEADVHKHVKQHRMVETRCYWNTDTAGSEEEFQCVRTWVSPEKKYFSVESRFDSCFVNPRTHSQAEMKRLLKIRKPVPECDDCG